MSTNSLFSRQDQTLTKIGSYLHYSSDRTPKQFCPWKLHIFLDYRDEYEINIGYNVILKSLINSEVMFKIVDKKAIQNIIGTKQEGKFFTIYPKSINQMMSLAVALDLALFHYIEDGILQYKDTHIVGDKRLELLSNRIFYRYELDSSEFEDKLFSTYDKCEEPLLSFRTYLEHYESNRGSSRLSYLAEDMDESSDPFHSVDLDELYHLIVLSRKHHIGETLKDEEIAFINDPDNLLNSIISGNFTLGDKLSD